jgi:hypothetical protein
MEFNYVKNKTQLEIDILSTVCQNDKCLKHWLNYERIKFEWHN